MYRKILVAGATAAVVLGAGTAALAASGGSNGPVRSGGSGGAGSSAFPPPPAAADSTAAPAGRRPPPERPALRKGLRGAVHGQVVIRRPDGSFVTRDEIRGTVTAVSSTSVGVRAADGTTQTYQVTGTTEVRLRANGSGSAGSLADVHAGDRVLVLGTGSDTLTANRIVDAGTG